MSKLLPAALFQDLIGRPYQLGGRGPDRFDCAGLAIEMQRRQGLKVEASSTPYGRINQLWAMSQILERRWRRLKTSRAGCLVYFPTIGHVGTMVDASRFLHTGSDLGESRIESLSAQPWSHRPRMFYVPAEVV